MPDEPAAAAVASLLLMLLAPMERQPIWIKTLRGLRIGNLSLVDEGTAILRVFTDHSDITITVEANPSDG